MAANASDMFQKVARSTATTLSAPGYTVGATSINVASTSNWPADTGITFGIDEVDGGGNRIAGTYNIFRGTVGSATQLANLTYVGGDANRNYSAGATTRVYILVSYARENRLVDGLLVSHDQDGTLKNNTVTTPKIADGAVTADKVDFTTGIWWEEIGRTTLSVAGDTITVSGLPARKYLKVIVSLRDAGGTIAGLVKLNNDSGNNYARRASSNGGADATATSSDHIMSVSAVGGAAALPVLANIDIVNWSNDVKMASSSIVDKGGGTAATAPGRSERVGTWFNTDQINRIDVTNNGTGDFAIGSEIIVLGTD